MLFDHHILFTKQFSYKTMNFLYNDNELNSTFVMSIIVAPVTMAVISFVTGNLSKQVSFVMDFLVSLIAKKETVAIFVSVQTKIFSQVYGKCVELGVFDKAPYTEITFNKEIVKGNIQTIYNDKKDEPIYVPSTCGNNNDGNKKSCTECGSFRLEKSKALVNVSCNNMDFRYSIYKQTEGLQFSITSYVPSAFIRFIARICSIKYFATGIHEQKLELQEWLCSGDTNIISSKSIKEQIGVWKPRSDCTFWQCMYVNVRLSHTVILPDGVYSRILERCRDTLSVDYGKDCLITGCPWRLGVTLHGPPGVGKTSLVQALAYDLGATFCALNLSVLDDAKLISLFTNLPSNENGTIVLIEDIDDCEASHLRLSSESTDATNDNSGHKKKSSVSAAGLFNILDGIYGPSQCVFIITTNHLDKLDPAITREGRAGDVVVRISPPGPQEVERAFMLTFANFTSWVTNTKISKHNRGCLTNKEHIISSDYLKQKARKFANTVINPISMSAVRSFLNANRKSNNLDEVIRKASEIRTL